MKPLIFDLDNSASLDKYNEVKLDKSVRVISPIVFIKEVVKTRNPHIQTTSELNELQRRLKTKLGRGIAIYYPWRKVICLVPSQKIFFELATARNRHLIRQDEQHSLRKTVVAFFGMSVGSQAALTWMLESQADEIRIADPDVVDPTNLNRVRFGVVSVGRKKVDVTEEALYETNPFCKIYKHSKSSVEKIETIISSKPRMQVVVDEIDDIEVKLELRKMARKYKLPLVSAADVGDNVIIDIERYDMHPQSEPFLGRLPELQNVDIGKLDEKEKVKLIIKLVGFEANADRIPDSIMSIGGSLRTWPQLGATATMAGGIVATTIKNIILGEKVESGRYVISLDEIINADFHSRKKTQERSSKVEKVNFLLDKY